MNEFLSVKEISVIWNLSERSVRNYCSKGRVEGAIFDNGSWLIPSNAKKPIRKNEMKNKNYLLTTLRKEKTNKYNMSFNRNFIISKDNESEKYKLVYYVQLNNRNIIGDNFQTGEVFINIYQKVNNVSTKIHELNFEGIKLQNINKKYCTHNCTLEHSNELDWVVYKVEVELDWNEISVEQIELSFDVNLNYITDVYIINGLLFKYPLSTTLPTALFPGSSETDLIFNDMYRFDFNSTSVHDSNKLCKTTMYGLCNPNKIYYKDSNRVSVVLENITISLQELMTNSVNMGKQKNVFWYNNYKNIMIEDDLYYYDGPLPYIYFENNDFIRISNLCYTIPFQNKNGEKSYFVYYNNNLSSYLGNQEMDVTEFNIKETSDGRMLLNIKHKDKYNRVISEEITDRLMTVNDNPSSNDYINIKKQYCYDINNNLISEAVTTTQVYDNLHSILVPLYSITYQYDERNNLISVNDNGKITNYQYDENDNLIKVSTPLQNEINYLYDNKDRCINMTQSSQNRTMSNFVYYNNDLLDKLKYNDDKCGYKYSYNNYNMLDAVYKINNTDDYNLQIESYELVETIDTENKLGLEEGQYGKILTLANGEKYAYIYDKYNKLLFKKQLINNVYEIQKEYIYQDAYVSSTQKKYQSLLKKEIDYTTKIIVEYLYDENNYVAKVNRYLINENEVNTIIDSFSFQYEENKLVSSFVSDIRRTLEYGKAELLSKENVAYNNDINFEISYNYNDIGELINKTYEFLDNNLTRNSNYTFFNGLLQTYSLPYRGNSYLLTYDQENKITSIKNNSLNSNQLELTYDAFGQVVEEVNTELNKKYKYTYDLGGNIISKEVYDLNNNLLDNTEYVYGGPNYDVLTKIIDTVYELPK